MTATLCVQCGQNVRVDEDGCCVTCGCDAMGPGADAFAALVKALRECSNCVRCGGYGNVGVACPDPQCGDSTWDHDCQLGVGPCPDCLGSGKQPAARAALKLAGVEL